MKPSLRWYLASIPLNALGIVFVLIGNVQEKKELNGSATDGE